MSKYLKNEKYKYFMDIQDLKNMKFKEECEHTKAEKVGYTEKLNVEIKHSNISEICRMEANKLTENEL